MSLPGWLLLLAVVAVIGAVLFVRRQRVRRPAATSRPTLPSSDDLSTLGLSEVRARSADAPAPEPVSRPAAPSRPAPASEPRAPATDFDDVGVSAARPASRPAGDPPGPVQDEPARPRRTPPEAAPFVRPDTDLWAEGDRAAVLLLASLAESAGAPAAVVRLDEGLGVYVVEAFAGEGPRPGDFDAEATKLHRVPQDRVVTLLDSDRLGVKAFGENGVCVRALAEPPAARALLVVGVADAEPDEAATRRIGRYADLLADLTALPEVDPPSEDAEPDDTSDAEPRSEPPAGGALLPRVAIIEAEQAAAAEAGRPLAFALVTLAEAEALLTKGAPDEVAEAEVDLLKRLKAASDVRRVEPFGDLLFGVFLEADREAAAAWCHALASDTPPLFIGAVAPADGDAQAIRAAAAEALHDAYDQQRTQVVEV